MNDSSTFRKTSYNTNEIPSSQLENIKLLCLYQIFNQYKRIRDRNQQQQPELGVEIDPRLIRFSQDTVNNPTRIKEIENSMKKNGWNGDAIDVVRMPDGKLTSVDNRRILVAKRISMKVKARIHDHNEPLRSIDHERFTMKRLSQFPNPKTWGKAVEYRVVNQNSFYMRNVHPYGTYDEPYITGSNTSKLVNKHDYDLPENIVKEPKKRTEKRLKTEKMKSTITTDRTSQNSHIKSKLSKPGVDHPSSQKPKHITRAKPEAMKSTLQKKETPHGLFRTSINRRKSQTQTHQIWRTCNQRVPLNKGAVSVRAPAEYISIDQKVKVSTKSRGFIKTTAKYKQIVFNGSKHNSMHETHSHTHVNPFYKKITTTEVGRNHRDPTQNYKRVKSKYSIRSGTKIVGKAGINTAVDKALYAAFATNKGRPSVGETVTAVAGAVSTAVVDSVVPGGRLLTTLAASIATGNYENLPRDLLLAAPSLIPGNPIHFEHQQTQANGPLFGSDLRSDNVERYSADLSIPYLHGLGSVGICYDHEQIEFSRDGVTTNRDATAINAHASLGSTLDASVGFSSGTEISKPVTKETADGMTETTHWEKQFSGQFGARLRIADRKAAKDIGAAYNEVTTTTTIRRKTATRSSTVFKKLSPTHLKEVVDDIRTYFGYSALTDDHELRVHGEKIVVEQSSRFFGLRTDKTQITSRADGTAYEVRQNENIVGTCTIREIEKDYYKKIQHLGTENEIISTGGEKDIIRTVRNVEGILQPEVITTIHETQQNFERTNEVTTFQDPHLIKTLDVKQSYGLLTNKTEVTTKTLLDGTDKTEKTTSEVVETLGGAASSALSSLTSNVLHMAYDPAARTMRNVRNAVIDVGIQGVVGWAHSNVAVRENSIGSAAVASIVSVAANSVTKVCSSNSETLSTKTVLTDAAVSSASPVVSLAVNVSNKIPIPLRNNAAAITSLVIRTRQTIQNYRDSRVNLEEAKIAILQEITSIITNCGIQTYLVPELVSLLPLSSLGVSIAACIVGAALSFASFKLISWVMNMRQEQFTKQEYENFCNDLGVNSTDTDATIDSRYRRLALSVHPDKVGGDATRFKKLTQDFERLHQLRSRYNIQPDRSQTGNIIKLLKEFFEDPMCFLRYLSQMTTSSSVDDPVVIQSPLMLTL